MKIRIEYTPWVMFPEDKKCYWFWIFKRYRYCRGIAFRIFGWWFNITENNATEKMIAKFKETRCA